jgi:hypothetical protein
MDVDGMLDLDSVMVGDEMFGDVPNDHPYEFEDVEEVNSILSQGTLSPTQPGSSLLSDPGNLI